MHQLIGMCHRSPERLTEPLVAQTDAQHGGLRAFAPADEIHCDSGRGRGAWARRDQHTVMLGGELTDLMRVRRYLDAERGAW